MSAGYKFLPHTTDAYIEAYGTTLEEAFAYAALSLFDTICNVNSISKSVSEEVQITAGNESRLLYDWLEALLLKFELERKVYSGFDVKKISRDGGSLKLRATISGERYDKSRHGAKVEVKAVTFHRMELLTNNRSVVLRFILDL
jgi:SHS2 domain-containing protein